MRFATGIIFSSCGGLVQQQGLTCRFFEERQAQEIGQG